MGMEAMGFVPKKETSIDAELDQYLTTPFEDLPPAVQEKIKNWTMGGKVEGMQTYH